MTNLDKLKKTAAKLGFDLSAESKYFRKYGSVNVSFKGSPENSYLSKDCDLELYGVKTPVDLIRAIIDDVYLNGKIDGVNAYAKVIAEDAGIFNKIA